MGVNLYSKAKEAPRTRSEVIDIQVAITSALPSTRLSNSALGKQRGGTVRRSGFASYGDVRTVEGGR